MPARQAPLDPRGLPGAAPGGGGRDEAVPARDDAGPQLRAYPLQVQLARSLPRRGRGATVASVAGFAGAAGGLERLGAALRGV